LFWGPYFQQERGSELGQGDRNKGGEIMGTSQSKSILVRRIAEVQRIRETETSEEVGGRKARLGEKDIQSKQSNFPGISLWVRRRRRNPGDNTKAKREGSPQDWGALKAWRVLGFFRWNETKKGKAGAWEDKAAEEKS